MYQPSNEAHEFVGDSVEEALQRACQFFGVAQDGLLVSELPAGEVYGAAGRAVIVALRKDRDPVPSRGGGERREREPRGREDDDDSDGRGGRRRSRRDRRGRGPAREAAAAEEPAGEAIEATEGTVVGELGELGQFVFGIVERLDLGVFEVSESSQDDLLVIQVTGNAARRMSAGEGRAADALHLIANQAALRGEDPQRVVVDVEGDAESREALIGSLAQRAAKRARSTGRAIALDAMNPRDRRAVHLALREERDIATMSIGEGRYRQVVVVPEGAPEYEEALRQSERSSA